MRAAIKRHSREHHVPPKSLIVLSLTSQVTVCCVSGRLSSYTFRAVNRCCEIQGNTNFAENPQAYVPQDARRTGICKWAGVASLELLLLRSVECF